MSFNHFIYHANIFNIKLYPDDEANSNYNLCTARIYI
jgi:hypothetical protein